MPEETIAYHDPSALVQTDWLEAHRGDTNLRIFDCTTHLQPAEPGTDIPYRIVSGKADYDAGHIPGAGFLDIQGELSDNTTKLRFMLPSPDQFAAIMSRHGVGEGRQGRSVQRGQYHVGDACLVDAAGVSDSTTRRSWMVVGKNGGRKVARFRPSLARILRLNSLHALVPTCSSAKSGCGRRSEIPHAVIVNALSPDLHSGKSPSRYGRPGRVPGSVNVPAATLLDSKTKAFVPLADARTKFDATGVEKSKNVICYCGGGISATVDLFMLYQLGYQNLTLYDGSMGEWARDDSLPIETD